MASVSENFSEMGEQMENGVTHFNHDLEELGKIAKKIAMDTVHKLQGSANEYYEQGLRKMEGLEKNIEGKIQENPVPSLLIAGAAGLVIGYLWSRI